MDEKLSSLICPFKSAFVLQNRARVCARGDDDAQRKKRRSGKTSTKTSPSSFTSSSTTRENNDESVVFLLLLLSRPKLLFVVRIVAKKKCLLSTSECGVDAVGGKDFGDVVARVSRARVLKRPPETRLRRRDAPRAD